MTRGGRVLRSITRLRRGRRLRRWPRRDKPRLRSRRRWRRDFTWGNRRLLHRRMRSRAWRHKPRVRAGWRCRGGRRKCWCRRWRLCGPGTIGVSRWSLQSITRLLLRLLIRLRRRVINRRLLRYLRHWRPHLPYDPHAANNPIEHAGNDPLAGEFVLIYVIREDQRLQNRFRHLSNFKRRLCYAVSHRRLDQQCWLAAEPFCQTPAPASIARITVRCLFRIAFCSASRTPHSAFANL